MQPSKKVAALIAALMLMAPLATAGEHDERTDDDAHDAADPSEETGGGDESLANATEDDSDDHADHDHDDVAENATEEDDDARERADEAADRDGEDEDRGRDEDEDRRGENARREVKVSVDAQRAVFELEKEDASDSEEEIKLDYSAAEGVLKLEFKNESEDAESAFEYKVEAERIVEYVDANGNGVYDEDVDKLEAEYKIDEGMEWTVLGAEDITVDNKTGRKVTAEGTFHDINGTMRIVFYAFGDFANLEGASLRPTEVKFDFVFEDFEYRNASSALALELKVEYESEYEGVASDTGLQASAGSVAGYFQWADWALVDGNRTDVKALVFEDESETEQDGEGGEVKREQKLYLNYARGRVIVHDPILGVSYQTAQSADTTSGDGSGDTSATPSGDDTTTPPASVSETPFAGVFGFLAAVAIAVTARRRNA